MSPLPSVFVSHGSPALILEDAPARTFLRGLEAALPRRPEAILCVSAHWETRLPAVSAPPANVTIHDFYGFPKPLYELRYPAPPAPELAKRVVSLLDGAGLPCEVDRARGLDHGAWAPLLLAWPDASIPVAQLSVLAGQGAAAHMQLGATLAPLRDEGVLILGSGSFTHDLRSFATYGRTLDAPEPDWVRDYADWMAAKLESGDLASLAAHREMAPQAVRNHPTEEHINPLFVALGAGQGPARSLHASATYGILRMDAFAFDSAR